AHLRVEQDALGVVGPAEDLARTVIAIDVRSRRHRPSRSSIDIATDDGAAPGRMGVIENRKRVVRRNAETRVVVRAGVSLEDAPTVIGPGDDRGVDFFSRILPHVSDPLVSGDPVEAEPEGIPETEREDFIETGRRAEERIT